ARAADHLLARALGALADRIPNPSRTLVVFNSLGWRRDGWVEGDLPRGFQPVDLGTGEVPPLELLLEGRGFQRVRFLARGVPSVGYRCYTLRPLAGPLPAPVAVGGVVMETARVRVELDPASGSIRRWVDRQTGRDWVAADSPWGLNRHLYVTGADHLPNRLVQYSTVAPVPDLRIHAAAGGRLLGLQRHPWGLVARMECTNLHHPRLSTTVTLREDSTILDLDNRVEKQAVRTKEAAYFAFPLAVETPRFRLAGQNGFIDPARDLLPGAGREWFCHQEWISVAGAAGGAVRWSSPDAPLVTLGDLARGRWPREFGRRPATLYSYVMANYTPEGYQAAQGGEFRFRYQLQFGEAFDPVESHRRGAEALVPLELHEITRNDRHGTPMGDWPPDEKSFLEVAPGNLSLVTWKAAEAGPGTVVRVVEVGGASAMPRLQDADRRTLRLLPCTAVEDPLPGPPAPGVRPFGIGTFRVVPEPRPGR
ncbi:MAG: hypothetical protein ACKOET_18940, partial [Verrucomicrobiota bacterium]